MGSFPVDIDLRIDPRSALKSYEEFTRKAKALMAEVTAGVAGADKQLMKLQEDFARQMISTSTRAGRAIESSIKSLERQAEVAGKTRSEQLLVRQEKWIKMLGQDEAAIKRVTAAFERLIKVEQEQEKKGGGGHGGVANLLFRGTKDIFEGRVTYGVMDFLTAGTKMAGGGAAGASGTGMLAGISATTLAVGGLTVALAGAAAIGSHAAAAMGEYGRQIREIQGVTGMTVKEVQQLEIAAKMSGRSVESIVQAMRGFTQALEGTGSSAIKANKAFEDMGVDVVGLRLGTVSAYEAFEQMGEALKKNPDVFERNIEMMDILKKSGLANTQMFKDLKEAAERSKDLHIFSEEQVKEMDEMHRRMSEIELSVSHTFKLLEFYAGKTFIYTIDFVTKGEVGTALSLPGIAMGMIRQGLGRPLGLGQPDEPPAMGPPVDPLNELKLMQRARSAQFDTFLSSTGGRGLEGAEMKVHQLEKQLSDMRENTAANRASFVKDPDKYLADEKKISEELHKQKDLVESIKRIESERKTIKEALRKLDIEATERLEHPYGMLAADQKLKSIIELPGMTDADKARAREMLAPLRIEEIQQHMQRAKAQASEATQQVAEALGVEPRLSPAQFAQQGRAQTAAQARQLIDSLKRQQEENKEALRPLIQIQNESRKNEEAAGMRGVRLGGIMQPSTIESRLTAEARVYEIRKHAADQEAEDAKSRISQEFTTKENYENDLLAIRLKNEGEVDAAREEFQAKYLEELRHQTDAIKSQLEPLYQTLFTQPRQFGQQLRRTVTDAALKPIVSGMSEMTATALHPMIFGAGGTGGIAGTMRGMFGGGKLNDVQLINGAVPVHIVGSGGTGGGGGAGTSIFSMGGFNGGGGTPPFAPGPAFFGGGGGGGSFFGGGGGAAGGGSIFGGMGGGSITGGGPSVFDLAGLPMTSGGYAAAGGYGGGGGTLARMMIGAALSGGGGTGGGTSMGKAMFGNFAGILKNLKGNLGGFTHAGNVGLPGVDGQPGTDLGAKGGKITGMNGMAGAAIMAGGMMLAQAGLMGNNRGTVGGVFEGALGGAAVGLAMGGPLGAAIGAGVGLGIGVGEMIAGVESPQREAKRLVKQTYHIDINNQTADQIVAIAKQSYAGRVSLAVRAPEVRHMLGLYAAGTGQGSIFANSSNEARGASLVESGGVLSQQATYQYGQAFSQSSNLPVYGGGPTNVIGAPGGGMQLSLNIGGRDAATFLQGNVVTPEVVQSQYASAMYSSAGRVGQSLMMSSPGSIVS